MKDANTKFHFTAVIGQERKDLLTKAAASKLKAEIWQKGQKKSEVETFVIKDFSSPDNQFTLEFQATGMLNKLTGSGNKGQEILLKIPMDTIYIFTNTKLEHNAETGLYTCKLDSDVFKSQTRSNYRLYASKSLPIQFKIDGEVFDALDISAGGTSFMLSKDMKDRFPKGQFFGDCIIRFAKKDFNILSVKIAGHWPSKYTNDIGREMEGLKVGVQFEDIDKKVEEDLFTTINTEARGEEIRKKLENSLKS
jgi:c-di-GMP-binding flagellar brake protein YcgR